jgi:UDP-N-acetylglucosamine diphosphorylase/glucosamine-1-phosphate N-acetyltransferase
MNIILFDTEVRNRLLPFTHTRPVADIRCGILTMRERWEHLVKQPTSTLTTAHLQEVFHLNDAADNLYINGAVFATKALCAAALQLQGGEKLVAGKMLIAARPVETIHSIEDITTVTAALKAVTIEDTISSLQHVWDIFSLNDAAICADFELLTAGRTSAAIPEGVTVIGKENLFIEAGGVIQPGSIINASTGPVYVGKGAEIMEGCLVRGPLALCDHAAVKMGAKIYGATTIGPGCKTGGEINNTVFFANSNKGHDGYLGNAIIGEWCNLGADTNCSNLKNNYDEVKIWDEYANKSVKTGLTFCGLIMGDHSKAGINTMFNTGTVVGVSANVYGAGFPEKFIPSFCWGGADGMTSYRLDRAMETADRMMARRGKKLTDAERKMYSYIFEQTAAQREIFANG